jgi:hypothetical protein
MKKLPFLLCLLVVYVGMMLTQLLYAQSYNYRKDCYIKIHFENDVFQVRPEITDKDFTNGTRIEVLHNFSFLRKISPYFLFRFKKPSDILHGITIGQEMYTPENLSLSIVDSSDRPYAGWLFVSPSLTSTDVINQQKLSTRLDIGLTGKYSFAKDVQRWIHRSVFISTTPEGWDNQIQSTLGINYYLKYEKRFLPQIQRNVDIINSVEGSVGTITNFVGLGLIMRLGVFNDYFMNVTGIYRKYEEINETRELALYNEYNLEKESYQEIEKLKDGIDSLKNKIKYYYQDSIPSLEKKMKEKDTKHDKQKKEEIYKKIQSEEESIEQLKQEIQSREELLNTTIENKLKEKVIPHKSNKKLQIYCFLNPVFRTILDNSFLQGGWKFLKLESGNSPYTIKSDKLQRFYAQVEYGVAITYKFLMITGSQCFRTAEFEGDRPQQWGKIAIIFRVN